MKLWRIVFICLLLSGCNIFDLRTADPPDGKVEWNSYANTYEKCLENLVYSYNYRENVYKYSDILTDNFRFEFDREDVFNHSVPEVWEKRSETEMLINLFQQTTSNQSVHLELFPLENQRDDVRDRVATIYRGYVLLLNNNRNPNEELIGELEMVLEKETNGLWKIKEWRDYRRQSHKTWGRLKNEYSV